MKTEAQMYLSAAGILRRDGWCRLRLHDPIGRHCMMGAIDETGIEREAFMLSEVCGFGIANFNDKHCRSIDDAIAALEIAADLAS